MKNALHPEKINPAPDREPAPGDLSLALYAPLTPRDRARRLLGCPALEETERRFGVYCDAYRRDKADAERLTLDELEARHDATAAELARRRGHG